MTASVERVLEQLGVPAQRQGRRWWLEWCPMPSHGSPNPKHRWQNFFVNDDCAPEKPRAIHCYSCKARGSIAHLVAQVRGCTIQEAYGWIREIDDGSAVVRPYLSVRVELVAPGIGLREPEELEPCTPLEQWVTPARQYVESRGITPQQVERHRLRYAIIGRRLQGRIWIPTYGPTGRLANYAARSFCGDPQRYTSPREHEGPDRDVFWGEDEWPAPAERRWLVLFEGVINGMAIERALTELGVANDCYLAGLSGSVWNAARSVKLAGWWHCCVATDNDPAGRAAAEAIVESRRGDGTEFSRLPYRWPGDAADAPPVLLQESLARCIPSGVLAAR